MNKNFDQTLFNRWLELRESHATAKREKDYRRIIDTGDALITLAGQAPFIGIVVAIFKRDIADAYSELSEPTQAIAHYRAAIAAFEKHRATKKLNKPDDFLLDLERLRKKLSKLEAANK
ncbi:MAG: hypothetical protein LBL35_07940 [Clostridiales bacterium]|jgi:hypothetical protein|nr:hypothetical protein [Clostridiales bacterium]